MAHKEQIKSEELNFEIGVIVINFNRYGRQVHVLYKFSMFSCLFDSGESLTSNVHISVDFRL